MSYSELSQDDQLLTAIKFIAVGAEIPSELQEALGPELTEEVRNPLGVTNETDRKQTTGV